MVSSQMQASMLSILVALVCISETFVSGEYANFNKLELPAGVKGPGGLTFGEVKLTSNGEPLADGPFVTTLDGRIMKWNDTSTSFVDFAYTSLNRTKELCDGVDDPDMWLTCGRPFAVTYDGLANAYYIADAYRGIVQVNILGGLATQILGGFKFANGIDSNVAHIYFSDASLTYDVRDSVQPGFETDASGRLLHYDPTSPSTASVMLSGLRGGGGPVVSSSDDFIFFNDQKFVLISEIGSDRITKFWVRGDRSNTAEVLLNVTGNPNKITRAEKKGEFWVATTRIGYTRPKATIIPEGVRFNSTGHVLETVQFGKEYPNVPVSMVLEHEGKLYVGSHFTNFIGVYSK